MLFRATGTFEICHGRDSPQGLQFFNLIQLVLLDHKKGFFIGLQGARKLPGAAEPVGHLVHGWQHAGIIFAIISDIDGIIEPLLSVGVFRSCCFDVDQGEPVDEIQLLECIDTIGSMGNVLRPTKSIGGEVIVRAVVVERTQVIKHRRQFGCVAALATFD